MSRDKYFSSNDNIRATHETMYYYDSPSSQSSDSNIQPDTIPKNGKSAYEVAVDNGFSGTVEEGLESLKGQNGISPHVGENGNWFIGDIDTEVAAAANNIIPIPSGEIDSYFQNNSNSENISPLSTAELDKLFIQL